MNPIRSDSAYSEMCFAIESNWTSLRHLSWL